MKHKLLLTIVSALFVCFAACPVFCDEKPEGENVPKPNIFKSLGSIDEVKTVLRKLQSEKSAAIKDQESFMDFQKTVGEANLEAATKILDDLAKTPREKSDAYKLQIAGLKMLARTETGSTGFWSGLFGAKTKSESRQKLDALIDELEKDGNYVQLVNDERFQQFVEKVHGTMFGMKESLFNEYVEEAKGFVNREPKSYDSAEPLLLVLRAADAVNTGTDAPKLQAKDVADKMIGFVRSDACTLSADGKEKAVQRLEGFCRRCTGSELELYGKTTDDKDFDWKSLRGKYVLVKFTASWCGPCKGEIPGMLEAYEKYRDKDFEIVSVYVWDSLERTRKSVEEEKLPWPIVSEELTEKAGAPPQGKFYCIQGVPTMLLVGPDGKVADVSVRGVQLQTKLAELFDKK